MTPSATRPIPSRNASRRTRLLAASALCGVATMLAQPALAQLPGVPSAANITVSTGGSQPIVTAPDANTLEIDLNAPRTVINWPSLNVGAADAMNFHFDANSDIVLNKTTSQITIASGGTVTGKVGASDGGNIWFYSPQGVIVSPGAVMTGGGFLFSRGTGIIDAGFVDAADPLANLRAATEALIRINTISTATSASIDASGDVLLSASSGALNVAIAEGATVDISTTSGSITASEVTATSGAATVAAGGPGATVTSITGATGATVSSDSNTSVGSAATTTSGDIVLTSGGSVSLTLGNSARDTLLTAPLIFLSTLDAGRDAILTGDTGVTVTNRIFAGDDIELTASNGDITAGGAYLRSTGLGASDDAHILLRSYTGSVTATNTLQTQGTGTQAGDITVQAATTASAGTATATRDLKVSGVTASLTNGTAARDIFVTATTGGVTVTTAATAGDDVEVTATTGAVSAGGATLRSTGLGASNDGHVLARSTGSSVTVNAAQTQGTGATAGDVIISAATTANLNTGSSSRDLYVSGTAASLASADAARDIFVSGITGNVTVITSAIAGDDVEVTTVSGNVVAGGATLRSTGLATGGADGHVLARSSDGAVNVGAATTQGTGAAAGDVTIDAATTATLGLGNSSRDLTVVGVTANLTNGTATRDLFVNAATGGATVTTSATAGDDVEVTAITGAVSAGGATLRSTGVGASDDAHVLARSTGAGVTVGTALTEGTGAAAGDVTLSAATTATLTTGVSSRDLRVGGVTASLDSGDAVRDVFVTATTGGASVTTQITAGDDIEVTATSGGVSAVNAVLTSTGVGAADDAHVLLRSTASVVDFGVAITQGAGVAAGDVIIEAGDTAIGESAESTRDVSVTAPWGIALESATAARDITLFATVGDVTLGRAELTGAGAGHNLLLTADGVMTFGGPDASSIATTNTFSRTGGSTGLAVVRSLTADARVYLDASAAIDTLSGENIDVTVNTGPVTFGALTAQAGLTVWAMDGALNVGGAIAYNGDLELNAYGGAMTVGTINAPNGNLALYAYDDALTVTGSVHGGGQTQLQSFGLLDGTAASLISSDGALQLYGGQIDVGSVQADDVILVGADDGNIDVQSAVSGVGVSIAALDGDVFVDVVEGDTGVGVLAAGDVLINSVKANSAGGVVFVEAGGDAVVNLAEAKGAGGTVEVGAFGNATLRAAEATDGILVYASDAGRATFGADSAASITSANYALTAAGSGCGCSPAPDGLQVFSEFGDAVVNAYSVSNPIVLVASGEFNNVTVTLQTGDLKIDELAGYNITIDAKAGTLETVSANSGGGDYTITAHDFLGDALTPTLVTGLIRDVTITDTLGGLNLGTTALHADRRLTVTALNGGSVTGSGLLDAGLGANDGDVTVTAAAITLDAVQADRDVSLTAATGDVTLGTGGVHADRLLHITALSGALTSLGQLDAGAGAGAHDGEVNVAALGMTLAGVSSDGDVALNSGTGGVNLGGAVHADRILSITALNGAVTGSGQLDAGSGTTSGDIDVTGDAIGLDTVQANRDVDLDAGTGLVNVATSVSVDGTYRLTGGDFSAATLAPVGAKAGSWTIIDQAGDFDFTGKTLRYGSSIAVNVFNGEVIGGDITSDAGLVFVEADGGSLGALYAGGGQVTAIGNVGGMAVDSAQGVTRATVTAVNGTASLGSAILTGPGIHGLTVRATNGDVVLGAASPGAITTDNFVTSTGSSIALVAQALAGKVDVNLDHTTNANMTTLDGRDGLTVRVVNGSQRIVTARSTAGSVWITGPTGALTVDQLTAADVSQVRAGGETRLVSANVTGGGLSVVSNSAGVRLGDATPGRVIAASSTVSLTAATDITQQGVIHASGLGGSAGTGVVLLGDNQVDHLGAFIVHGGGLAFHNTTDFDVAAPINAIGQTVDLRSDGTINQVSFGVITAQKLTGSSVGGAIFDANNQVAELGDFTNTTSRLKLVNGRALTVSGTVLSTGILSLASHGGMTIAATGTVRANGAGDAVVLASDGVFTNARGADAVTAGGVAGRWLIYTQALGDPQGSTAGNTFNGLAGKSFYGSAYDFGTSGFAVGLNAGNRFVYAYQPTLTVTPDSQVVTYSGAIPSLSATVTGLVNGDLSTDAWTGALVISGATSKTVGTYALNAVTGGLTSDLNYAFAAGAPGSLRIDPKALTGVLTANDKTYDGATAATGAVALTGVATGDTVSAAGTYAFADKNAGTGKTVNASGVALTGADAGNYTLASTATGEADILKRDLTGALTAAGKTYDGTMNATGAIGLTGVLAGDAVTASGTYAFADRNAGAGKTVTASGAVLAGLDAGNYNLTGVSEALADILRRSVTVAADSGFKPFGQVEPTLTYRITVGDLAAGDAFTGALARAAGENPGDYGVTRGTLALSANYDLTFTGAVFTIRPIPSNDQGGSSALKHLNQSPDFTLDWDPEPNLTTDGQGAQGASSGGGLTVAALR